MNAKINPTGTLYGVGVGPGDPELLTLKALRIIQSVEIIAYPAPLTGDSFARSIVTTHLRESQTEIAIRMPLESNKFPARDVYDHAAALISEKLNSGNNVATLCEGDPFFYGSFMYLYERLAEKHTVDIIPGVSSPMACAAALGSPLAARNDVLSILPAPLDEQILIKRLLDCDSAAIVKIGRHIKKVMRVIHELELINFASYIERATLPNAKILPLTATPEPAPYFSMILIHKREKAWK